MELVDKMTVARIAHFLIWVVTAATTAEVGVATPSTVPPPAAAAAVSPGRVPASSAAASSSLAASWSSTTSSTAPGVLHNADYPPSKLRLGVVDPAISHHSRDVAVGRRRQMHWVARHPDTASIGSPAIGQAACTESFKRVQAQWPLAAALHLFLHDVLDMISMYQPYFVQFLTERLRDLTVNKFSRIFKNAVNS
jgi:hypothetical protein